MPFDVSVLAGLPLFRGLTQSELEELATHLRSGEAKPGETIIREGDKPGHPMYLLVSGSVEIVKHGLDGRDHVISTLAAPSVFGEMEVLAKRPAIAGVNAVTAARFALLGHDVFESLCGRDSLCILKVIKNLAFTLSYRLAATDTQLAAYFNLARTDERQKLGQVRHVLYAGWQTER